MEIWEILLFAQWPIWFVVFLAQTSLVKKGVAIVQKDPDPESRWEEEEVVNGFFGIIRTPKFLFCMFLIAPLASLIAICIFIAKTFTRILDSFNEPGKKKNKLVEEAEEEGLELKEFVKIKKKKNDIRK